MSNIPTDARQRLDKVKPFLMTPTNWSIFEVCVAMEADRPSYLIATVYQDPLLIGMDAEWEEGPKLYQTVWNRACIKDVLRREKAYIKSIGGPKGDAH